MIETEGIDAVLGRLHVAAIQTALIVTRGNITLAAEALKIQRTCLCERMRRYRIDAEEYRDPTEGSPPPSKRLSSGKMSAVYLAGVKMVVEALEAENGNRSRAASRLGLSLRCIRYKIHDARKLGFDVPDAPRRGRGKK